LTDEFASHAGATTGDNRDPTCEIFHLGVSSGGLLSI
jgi:hypothetical protein